jgi:hypothetical protein
LRFSLAHVNHYDNNLLVAAIGVTSGRRKTGTYE